MVAQINVGTVGTPVNGTDSFPANIAPLIQFTAGTTTPDQFGTIGAVDVGIDGVPIGTFISLSPPSSNAVTISGMNDAIADVVDGFSISWTPLGGGPLSTRTLTAADFAGVSTLDQLIAVIHAIDGSGPSDGVSAKIDPEGKLQITSPFLTLLQSVELSSSTGLAAEQTTVDITGVTDAEAADVQAFQITIDGFTIDTSGLDFSGVASRAELAAVLDSVPAIAVTESADNGGTITITVDTFGPRQLTDIVLGQLALTAATAQLGAADIQDLDARVAAADGFALKFNGSDVDFSGLDFNAIDTGADLTAALDQVDGISAQLVGATIVITSDVLGAGNAFSALQLIDNEAVPATAATEAITGVDAFADDAVAFSLLIDGTPVDVSPVDFGAVTDGATLAAELDGIAGISVSYSTDNGGTLLITADAAGAHIFSGLTLTRPNTLTGSDGVDDVLTGDPTGTLIQGLGGNDTLTGSTGEDRLEGGDGNDTLFSSGGDDSYDGGDGIDSISFAHVQPGFGANVRLDLNLISDGGFSDFNESIVNIENVVGSDGGDVIHGTTGANIIDGGGDADVLRGDAGDDTLIGGAMGDELDGGTETDTAWYNTAVSGGTLVIDLADPSNNTGEAAGDTYISIENITGSNGDDLIRGDTFANALSGRGGNDQLEGGDGDDQLYGGSGQNVLRGGNDDDWYFVADGSDTIIEDASQGNADRVFARNSFTLTTGASIENVSTDNHAGTGAINLTGNELANLIYGNAGANRLDGGVGTDNLTGWGGNDTYIVDSASDIVQEADGTGPFAGGSDTVQTSVSYALRTGSSIETFTTTDDAGTTAVNLTGNDFAQHITGNAGDNIIDGKGGDDVMEGLGGNDWYFVDNDSDQVIETGGNGNRVFASASWTLTDNAVIEKLSTTSHAGSATIDLTGNALGNIIYGNAGANVLNGKDGNDNLNGFGGADTFVFDTAPNNDTNFDVISDMTHNVDHIQLALSVFTALSGSPGGTLAASEFVASAAPFAADSDDHILYNTTTGLLDYDSNGNVAGGVTHIASVTGHPTLANTDFLLG